MWQVIKMHEEMEWLSEARQCLDASSPRVALSTVESLLETRRWESAAYLSEEMSPEAEGLQRLVQVG